jgi:hypothetical protein
MTRTAARQAMIEAAERLITERGMQALTLEDVQIAANQSNKSAAKYHSGSRHSFMGAFVEMHTSEVDSRRQRAVRLADRPDGDRSPIRPLTAETVGRPDSKDARLLVQAVFDPALANVIHQHVRADSYRRVHTMVIDLSPATRPVGEWRTDNPASGCGGKMTWPAASPG